MTRHHVITAAIFVLACVVFDQPDASAIETGIVAAACAFTYWLAVEYVKVKM